MSTTPSTSSASRSVVTSGTSTPTVIHGSTAASSVHRGTVSAAAAYLHRNTVSGPVGTAPMKFESALTGVVQRVAVLHKLGHRNGELKVETNEVEAVVLVAFAHRLSSTVDGDVARWRNTSRRRSYALSPTLSHNPPLLLFLLFPPTFIFLIPLPPHPSDKWKPRLVVLTDHGELIYFEPGDSIMTKIVHSKQYKGKINCREAVVRVRDSSDHATPSGCAFTIQPASLERLYEFYADTMNERDEWIKACGEYGDAPRLSVAQPNAKARELLFGGHKTTGGGGGTGHVRPSNTSRAIGSSATSGATSGATSPPPIPSAAASNNSSNIAQSNHLITNGVLIHNPSSALSSSTTSPHDSEQPSPSQSGTATPTHSSNKKAKDLLGVSDAAYDKFKKNEKLFAKLGMFDRGGMHVGVAAGNTLHGGGGTVVEEEETSPLPHPTQLAGSTLPTSAAILQATPIAQIIAAREVQVSPIPNPALSPPLGTIVTGGSVYTCGWMYKLGGTNTFSIWQKRFFILTHSGLLHYWITLDAVNGPRTKGTIDTNKAVIRYLDVQDSPIKPPALFQNLLSLLPCSVNAKRYVLATASLKERDEWVNVLSNFGDGPLTLAAASAHTNQKAKDILFGTGNNGTGGGKGSAKKSMAIMGMNSSSSSAAAAAARGSSSAGNTLVLSPSSSQQQYHNNQQSPSSSSTQYSHQSPPPSHSTSNVLPASTPAGVDRTSSKSIVHVGGGGTLPAAFRKLGMFGDITGGSISFASPSAASVAGARSSATSPQNTLTNARRRASSVGGPPIERFDKHGVVIPIESVLFAGLLAKQGGSFKSIKIRFFLLTRTSLCYYSENDSRPKDVIDLSYGGRVSRDDKKAQSSESMYMYGFTLTPATAPSNNGHTGSLASSYQIQSSAQSSLSASGLSENLESRRQYIFFAPDEDSRAAWIESIQSVITNNTFVATVTSPSSASVRSSQYHNQATTPSHNSNSQQFTPGSYD